MWIEPARIVETVRPSIVGKSGRSTCHVLAGSWDLERVSFADNYYGMHRSFEQHFDEGAAWEDTRFVQTMLHFADCGGPYWHNCTTRETILERCARVDDLYRSLRDDGFRPPPGVEHGRAGLEAGPRLTAIAVNVSRTGDLLYENGKHRLSLAKILGIPMIPVRMIARHASWQTRRVRYVWRSDPGRDRFAGHPDLSYLR